MVDQMVGASEGKSFVGSLHFAQDLDDPAICERFSRSASWEELYFIELSKDIQRFSKSSSIR